MRLRLAPESILERVGVWLGLAPSPLVHGFYGMAGAQALMTGVECGLFAALAGGPGRPTGALAKSLGLDAAALEHLLACLRTLGLVKSRSGSHALTRAGARWLAPDSKTYIGDFLRFNLHQSRWWSRLGEAMRPGAPAFDLHAWDSADPRWADYVRAMRQLARLAAPEVCARVPIPRGATTLLDLAGGHAAFSAELCRRAPALSATVVDLPGNNQVARELWPHPRIRWLDGDLFRAALPQADIVCCFQLLGHLQAEQRRELLARMRGAVKPGGTLALMDHFASSRDDASAFVALNYFLVARTARLTVPEVEEELRAAGWSAPAVRRIRRLPGQSLLISRAQR